MSRSKSQWRHLFIPTALLLALFAAALVASSASTRASAGSRTTPGVSPPQSDAFGKSYGEWSAAWWTWAMSLPVDCNPIVDDSCFDVTEGQSGKVWFLGSPFGDLERTATIPTGTAIFLAMNTSEASSLEGLGDTEAQQRANARFLTDHAVDPFTMIDGVTVKDIQDYRVESPQFTFTAPTPWIFGDVGGTGTSVADGYYVMIKPLSKGEHTIRFGETWHFSVAEGDPFDFDGGFDITYHITVR
jgi:hypothetical protein